jgi:hypothetical protein
MPVDFKPRKIKFKAWNTDSHLLMRLNSIDCNKGELFKKNHVLLQFTGLYDRLGEEVYDMDVLLIYSDQYLVFWHESKGGWFYSPVAEPSTMLPFLEPEAARMKRFCSYFELSSKTSF